MPLPLTTAAERLRQALDMFETGQRLMRQKLKREHPAATATEIDQLLTAWRLARPGAEHGDAPGRALPIPPELG